MNDYTKLIERLRVAVDVFETKGCVLEISAETCTEIADALEKLVKERDADGQKDAVKHGHWILEREPDGKPYCYHCSVCDNDFRRIGIMSATDYCPNCGARMGEEE